jgi:hypothetical protein
MHFASHCLRIVPNQMLSSLACPCTLHSSNRSLLGLQIRTFECCIDCCKNDSLRQVELQNCLTSCTEGMQQIEEVVNQELAELQVRTFWTRNVDYSDFAGAAASFPLKSPNDCLRMQSVVIPRGLILCNRMSGLWSRQAREQGVTLSSECSVLILPFFPSTISELQVRLFVLRNTERTFSCRIVCSVVQINVRIKQGCKYRQGEIFRSTRRRFSKGTYKTV